MAGDPAQDSGGRAAAQHARVLEGTLAALPQEGKDWILEAMRRSGDLWFFSSSDDEIITFCELIRAVKFFKEAAAQALAIMPEHRRGGTGNPELSQIGAWRRSASSRANIQAFGQKAG